MQNGYKTFLFKRVKEGYVRVHRDWCNNYGDKRYYFFATSLRQKGAGGVIPPNANLIF
jgi:hypothetical protein